MEVYDGPPDGGEVPVLERYYLENGGRVIDKNGAYLSTHTNEFRFRYNQ